MVGVYDLFQRVTRRDTQDTPLERSEYVSVEFTQRLVSWDAV